MSNVSVPEAAAGSTVVDGVAKAFVCVPAVPEAAAARADNLGLTAVLGADLAEAAGATVVDGVARAFVRVPGAATASLVAPVVLLDAGPAECRPTTEALDETGGCVVVVDDAVPDEVLIVLAGKLPPLEDSVLVGEARVLELDDELEVLDDPPSSMAVLFGVPVAPVVEGEFVDELPATAPDDELDVLFDDEPPELVSSAWAIPEPLASAAPTPRVIAPAPSHL
jgi:hypothetical protein